MNFGDALEAAKKGYAISREGWNGKNQKVYLVKGAFDGTALNISNPIPENHESRIAGIKLPLFEVGDKGIGTRLPNLNIRTSDGNVQTGWLATQSDMLAEDWGICAEPEGYQEKEG